MSQSRGKQLVIVGNTGNARLAHWYFTHDTDYEVVAFSVDLEYIGDGEFCGLPVVPFESVERHHPPETCDAFVAIGYSRMNQTRAEKFGACKKRGYALPNYISSRCSFLTREPIGENNLILEDNTIQPFVTIGDDNVFWSGNHVGHDVTIGNHCFITSHVVISGFTRIKDRCFLGVNATLRDDITIAEGTLVGAGAVIMSDTEEHGVYLPPQTTLIRKKSFEIAIS